jgi:endonuclease/exonuclease/phosphatase family metal-dependent hydrolase
VILSVYKKQREIILMNHMSRTFVQDPSINFVSAILSGPQGGIITIWKSSKFESKLVFSITIQSDRHRIYLGDFNIICSSDNRNKPRANIQRMLDFNNVISQLDLQETPLKGQAFMWSNMQHRPLLEKLDWCFVSQAWSTQLLGTSAQTLARDTSHHVS